MQTLDALTQIGQDDAIAIKGAEEAPLTYSELRTQIHEATDALYRFGFSKENRIAVVAEKDPERGTAILATASRFVAAPLRETLTKREYLNYFSHLKCDAVIVDAMDSPAAEAAQELGLKLIEMHHSPEHKAGQFTLIGEDAPTRGDETPPGPDDTCLLLQTSGTTAPAPKKVPLTHRNITAVAQSAVDSFGLSDGDVGFSMLPSVHLSGFAIMMLGALASGGQIYLSKFSPTRFMEQFQEAEPSWLAGVTTMYQAILHKIEQDPTSAEREFMQAYDKLRFVRSGSMSLPEAVIADMKDFFGDNVAIIESYGLTEAGHTASNRVGFEKRETAGFPSNETVEVMVIDEYDQPVQTGMEGQIAVTGPNVFAGYEDNEEANEATFFEHDGKRWIKTGDVGVIDAEGYISVKGRIKEIINVSGLKVSPLEVDSVLLPHPYIAEVATFPIPHTGTEPSRDGRVHIGETIATAVVLREGVDEDYGRVAQHLRDYAREHLSEHKIPSSFIFMPSIPKSAMGKVKRSMLAEQLNLPENWIGDISLQPNLVADAFLKIKAGEYHWQFSDRSGDLDVCLTHDMAARVRERNARGQHILDLSLGGAGEPIPEAGPAYAEAILHERPGYVSDFSPTKGIMELRNAIAEKLQRQNSLAYNPETEVIAGVGGKSVLDVIFRSLLDEGDRVVLPAPYWPSYPELVKLSGGIPDVVHPPFHDGSLKMTPEQLDAAIGPETRVVLLTNPVNPSGAVYSTAELEAFARVLCQPENRHVAIVADEAFEAFIYGDRPASFASLEVMDEQGFIHSMKDRTITVNGVGKTYRMPGWRVGYAAGPEEVIERMEKVQANSVSSTAVYSQLAATRVLQSDLDAEVQAFVDECYTSITHVVDTINRIPGLHADVPEGTYFVFACIDGLLDQQLTRPDNGELIRTGDDFITYMLDVAEVALLDGRGFGMPGYVRINCAKSADVVREACERIESAMQTLLVANGQSIPAVNDNIRPTGQDAELLDVTTTAPAPCTVAG